MMSIHDLGGKIAFLKPFQRLDTQRVVVHSHEEEIVTESMELVREGLKPMKLSVQKLEESSHQVWVLINLSISWVGFLVN